jgi:hypothetical protein
VVAPGLHVVVIGLGAGGPADGRVGEVHVWRHGRGVGRTRGLGVGKVIGRPGGRHAAMRRRSPPKASHVGASIDTVGAVIAGGRRLQRLRRRIGMRSHGWADVRGTAIAGERGRCRSRRSSRATLGEVTAHMRRDGTSTHVIVAGGSVHVQRGQFTTGGHRGMLPG